jgi:simple sugar transport system ATP-binding protein
MALAPALLEFRSVSKRFGPLLALDRVSLGLGAREVLALLGENGAGKSTLMSLLFGLLAPDAGEIRIDGRPARIRSPADARRLGVGMVHQHFTLVGDLTVAENLVLDERGRSTLWLGRRRHLEARVRDLGAGLGFRLDPRARVDELSVGDQQRLEILKAVKRPDLRLLVLDEPTANLSPGEVDDLLAVVRRLVASGCSVVFITHKLREVAAVADRVVVLRRGAVVAERAARATSIEELAQLMVGDRELGAEAVAGERGERHGAAAAVPARPGTGPPLVETRGLVVAGRAGRPPALRGVDLTVERGEVVGIAGVDGNGQTELGEALFGLRPRRGGTILVDGRDEPALGPRRAIDLGIAYVPADRRRTGLAPSLSLADNLLLGHYRRRRFGRGPLLDRRAVRVFAVERIASFDIRPAEPRAPAARLSGGNQQRVVLARELAFAPRLLIVENPTRGLDVRATEFVHDRLVEAARGGAGVLLVSTDLDEVLNLADRLYVLHEGRLAPAAERDPRTLGLLMGGAPGRGAA